MRNRAQGRPRATFVPREMLSRRPSCSELHVEAWNDARHAHISVYDADRQVVAEWWDEDVVVAFERGLFVDGPGFEESVIARLQQIGTCRVGGGRGMVSGYRGTWRDE